MDKEQKRKICGLIRRIMAAEAREIYLKYHPAKSNRKYLNIPNVVNIKGIKKQIIDFISEDNIDLNPEAVKKYALRYLIEHEAIATVNPSYKVLRERIERGEYDFSFVLWK